MWTLNFADPSRRTIVFTLGSALYLFISTSPELLNTKLPNDADLPVFSLAQELPPGIVGIVVTALFAGSMGTLSSCINSVAMTVVTDFTAPRSCRGATEKKATAAPSQNNLDRGWRHWSQHSRDHGLASHLRLC